MEPHYDDIYPPSENLPQQKSVPEDKPGEVEVLKQNMLYWEKTEAQIKELESRLAGMDILMEDWNQVVKHILANTTELQAKLKETIRAVEKLARGKSLGALGLPTEESWQQSTS